MSDFGKIQLDVMSNYIIKGTKYVGGKLAITDKGILFRRPDSALFAFDTAVANATNPIISRNIAENGSAQIFVSYENFAKVENSRQLGISPAITIFAKDGSEYKFVVFSRKKVLDEIAKFWKGDK